MVVQPREPPARGLVDDGERGANELDVAPVRELRGSDRVDRERGDKLDGQGVGDQRGAVEPVEVCDPLLVAHRPQGCVYQGGRTEVPDPRGEGDRLDLRQGGRT